MDIEFKAVRHEDGGPILNWIADRAIKLSEWLLMRFEKYALFYVMEFDFDENEFEVEDE